jgi:hypothetical protein
LSLSGFGQPGRITPRLRASTQVAAGGLAWMLRAAGADAGSIKAPAAPARNMLVRSNVIFASPHMRGSADQRPTRSRTRDLHSSSAAAAPRRVRAGVTRWPKAIDYVPLGEPHMSHIFISYKREAPLVRALRGAGIKGVRNVALVLTANAPIDAALVNAIGTEATTAFLQRVDQAAKAGNWQFELGLVRCGFEGREGQTC